MSKVVALLTDFGYSDNFVGVMKGVILGINPDIQIVDLTHEIQPQNVLQASWLLATSYKYFPKGTIFVSVVDPGVGTERKKLLIKTDKYYFIAPDNGLLALILDCEKIEKVISLKNTGFFLKDVSTTFHGRDIFAPVAAYLSTNQYQIDEFGNEMSINELKRLNFVRPQKNNKFITGQIMNIDHFGNVITNIPAEFLTNVSKIKLYLNSNELDLNLYKAYAETEKNTLLAIIGSDNTLEISQNYGNAQAILDLRIGDSIKIELK